MRASRPLLPLAASLLLAASPMLAQKPAPLRPPATPLIVHDPYFSLWSDADHLTDDTTRHWTGAPQSLNGLIRVDGKSYRFLGKFGEGIPALDETHQEVTPTRTLVTLANAEIELELTFLTPAFPNDLPVMSRPVTYLTWSVKSRDGHPHEVTLFLDAAATFATNDKSEKVVWMRNTLPGLNLLRVGTTAQPMLARSGDDVRIDWGWFYLGIPAADAGAEVAAGNSSYRAHFLETGHLPQGDDLDAPRSPDSEHPPAPTLDIALPLGSVGAEPVSRHILLAYDDGYSVEYLQRKLLPYWRKQFPNFSTMLEAADHDYARLNTRAEAYDRDLEADLVHTGGPEYAAISVLAFRQAIAAHKLVEDSDGVPFFMPKENFSNGSISTVDVIYPSAPMFLLLNPKLVEAQLDPVLRYAAMPRWKFPFAPHDLGKYPLANGQLYGGGEETEEDQMPVEESGDILILSAALAHIEGNAQYAARYWPLLTKWADYLLANGLDPANQLSTDDFSGHLAHNTNLSIKAIEGIGAYAQLAAMLGHAEVAKRYRSAAQGMAAKWAPMAVEGDHYKLAFDQPDTWSQKYNLVWDTLLGLDLFPPTIAAKEVAFYKTKLNKYGLPLDNRATFTKLDWSVWSATLATQPADFQTLVHPIYLFLNESPSRVPMTDWYDTVTGKMVGFQARSVVGGVYIKMLSDSGMWKKWAGKGAPNPAQP
ncbi:MAG: glutaminase domain-containing protein [Acidobacteriaceae bacterium]